MNERLPNNSSPQDEDSKLKGAVVRNRILLLCVLLGCAGCRAPGPAQTVENYYPFAVGNSWTYTRGDTTDYDTETITSEFTDAGSIHWYEWGHTEDADCSAYIDGKVVFSDVADDTLGVIMLKEPFEVGATWIYDPSDGSSVSRIEDTKASVSTHAGEFANCIEVSTRREDEEFECYFAPGVGLVKWTAPGEEDGELYEYDLK